MSTYDMIIDKGFKVGFEQGIELVLINIITKYPEYSDKEITDITGLRKAKVAEVREILNSRSSLPLPFIFKN